MELTANAGKGYQPAVMNRPVDAPIGLIPVDSLYSPVRQVSYKVGAGCRLPAVRPGKRYGGPAWPACLGSQALESARSSITTTPDQVRG